MTQYLATCLNCGGKVNHLEQSGTVERCSACKGLPQPKKEVKK